MELDRKLFSLIEFKLHTGRELNGETALFRASLEQFGVTAGEYDRNVPPQIRAVLQRAVKASLRVQDMPSNRDTFDHIKRMLN